VRPRAPMKASPQAVPPRLPQQTLLQAQSNDQLAEEAFHRPEIQFALEEQRLYLRRFERAEHYSWEQQHSEAVAKVSRTVEQMEFGIMYPTASVEDFDPENPCL
jgi:hypothetical protein